VTWAGKRYGYGNLVEINHGNGYVTRYGHNKEIVVSEGDTVKKGQAVAKMGSTGRSTGPHVHFEVIHRGKHVNPQKYIQSSR
jgi:murein DD-endopeptidase MepM/ murein hydrolase activator NlpD